MTQRKIMREDRMDKKVHSGQKLLFFEVFICALLCVFCLFSCSKSIKDPLFYKEKAFFARVKASGLGGDFEAIFFVSEDKSSFSAELTSPQSLSGIVLSQEGSEMSISLGEKKFLEGESEILRGLKIGKIAEMLAPGGKVTAIKSEGGLTAVTAGDVKVYIDPKTSLPVAAESEGIVITVLDFWYGEK